MTKCRLLLLSNSTNAGEPFLGWPENHIKSFLGTERMTIAFAPFAAVRLSCDDYAKLVIDRFESMGHSVISLHDVEDPQEVVQQSDAIVVGGGNTFNLLSELHALDLLDPIRERALAGIPYIGWSAGSNVACPTIRTTNDMPIVEPPSLDALGLIPFQLNPHYTNELPPGLRAETREERLLEYIELNRDSFVVGLREGSLLRLENAAVDLIASSPARLFHYGTEVRDINMNDDLSFLLR